MVSQFCQKSCNLPPTGPAEGAIVKEGRGGGAVVVRDGLALPVPLAGVTSRGREEIVESEPVMTGKSVPVMRDVVMR